MPRKNISFQVKSDFVNMESTYQRNVLDFGWAIKGPILNALRKIGRHGVRLYKITVSTFENEDHIPVFDYAIHVIGGNPSLEVGDTGQNPKASEIYRYLDEGTEERWAVLSDDWESKTQPGMLFPGTGRGEVLIRGEEEMTKAGYYLPFKGNDPRDFSGQVTDILYGDFLIEIEKAVHKGIDKIFG